jgi:SM-20-related protein
MTYLVKILVNSSEERSMNARFEDLITGYLKDKVGISEHFLSDALCEHLKDNLLLLNDHNLMKSAGIGNDGKLIFNEAIRSDIIYWLDKKHNNEHENEFFEKIDAFVSYLNQTCYTNIMSYEFHYSLYEAGDFYRKHLDQFSDNSSRQFSMVSYLNPDWKTKDGGELLIHQTNNNQMVTPTQGKTIFFKSNELEHEVLMTNERRMSVTGWLKRG